MRAKALTWIARCWRDWVGRASELLAPLTDALREHVFAADVVHGDDTPIPVLAPGRGKTKTGRLWTYVRDERPAGGQAAPAVWFTYTPDRKGEHPQRHLATSRHPASRRLCGIFEDL